MTLEEAKDKFLNKKCNINWAALDRPLRKGETVVSNIQNSVLVTNIYQNCYNEILFECESAITTPFRVERLTLAE